MKQDELNLKLITKNILTVKDRKSKLNTCKNEVSQDETRTYGT